MQVKKRDGRIEEFDYEKLRIAISKAFEAGGGHPTVINFIVNDVASKCYKLHRIVDVDEIHKFVVEALLYGGSENLKNVAIKYNTYVSAHKARLIDRKIMSLLNDENEDVTKENGNKDTKILSTKRDYIAGEMNRYLAKEYILPKDIVEAHEKGEIHIHDMDFLAEPGRANCCLVNLKDMLGNGTCINGTKIDTPHTFSTACTIATQIALGVSASQYGGQTFSMAHLAKYIDASRKYYRKLLCTTLSCELDKAVDKLVKEDIVKGVQTLQYQVITLATANGQAPFITFYMDLGEAEDEQHKKDCAEMFAEILKQRIKGVKNREGQWVNPPFPKLIYALDEENMRDGEYYWLTKIAAECSAHRLVPDYISKKKQRELKQGQNYPCMGRQKLLAHVKLCERLISGVAA